MGNASPKGKVRQEPPSVVAATPEAPAEDPQLEDLAGGPAEDTVAAEILGRDEHSTERAPGRGRSKGPRSPPSATSSWVDGVLASSAELSAFEEDMAVLRMSDLLKATQGQLQACLALEKQLLKMAEGPQRYRRVERFCVEAERTQAAAAASLAAAAALAAKVRAGAGCTAARLAAAAEQRAAADAAEQARRKAAARNARVKAEIDAARQFVHDKARLAAEAEAAKAAQLAADASARHAALLAQFWRLARAEVAAHLGQLLAEVALRSEASVPSEKQLRSHLINGHTT